jgi:cytoskeletal protein RodZ
MIYAGRPGLLNDWQQFQREARVNRRKAEEARKRKQEKILEYGLAAVLALILLSGIIGLLWWMAFLKGYV